MKLYVYVSGHSEEKDIAEFFSQGFLPQDERPLAFFDGVFYESHQERVGNIVYQDYLVYSDRAVYLWARGASKDYLDRFPLGAVSVNSRNKDSDFATMNLRIRREGKEPVFVIFDMVELPEAEKISTLHALIEAEIETALGGNYRGEVPSELSGRIGHVAMSVCPPRHLDIMPGNSQPGPGAIGYGQELLDQFKVMNGMGPNSGMSGQPGGGPGGAAQIPDPLKAIEGALPTDPEAMKRIASNIKGLVGDAPFKLRDQVIKDLQHVPGDVASMIKAANELITNIADNPQAEKFVMNIVRTAVRNDGIIGSMGKLMKMGASFAPGGKKSSPPSRQGQQERNNPEARTGDEGIQRKKIRVQADDVAERFSLGDDFDDSSLPNIPEPPPTTRKKVRIKSEESPEPAEPMSSGLHEPDAGEPVERTKKIPVRDDRTTSDNACVDKSDIVAGDDSPSGATPQKLTADGVYKIVEVSPSRSKNK